MHETNNSLHRVLVLLLAFLIAFPAGLAATNQRAGERSAIGWRRNCGARMRRRQCDPGGHAQRPTPSFRSCRTKSTGLGEDRPLPIGYGQTISQPLMVAIMTELIKPRPDIKVLEIGTGSGYQAAILASAGAEVYSVEILSDLAASARDRLERLGYRNISVKNADGYHGWPEAAPFDAIIVTAAAEFIPPPLVKQLAEGASMIIPVGSPFHVQTLMMVQKRDGKPYTTSLMPVMFVPFTRSGQ